LDTACLCVKTRTGKRKHKVYICAATNTIKASTQLAAADLPEVTSSQQQLEHYKHWQFGDQPTSMLVCAS
jgi:hypothetical protein